MKVRKRKRKGKEKYKGVKKRVLRKGERERGL